MELFSRLHALAASRNEDFTSESLAIVLGHLIVHDPQAAMYILERISTGVIASTDTDPASITISTRVLTEQGYPDIEISCDTALVFVEAKVSAGLSTDQLRRYRRALQDEGKERRTALITLSKLPLRPADEQPDRQLYWHHVVQWFREIQRDYRLTDVSGFLVSEYVDLLRLQGLALDPPGSAMSAAITSYLSAHFDDNVFAGRSIRTLTLLEQIPELRPVFDFLHVLGETLRLTFPTRSIRLWSGSTSRKGSPWIGYNIDFMKYYVDIYLDRADELVFETLKAPVNTAKFQGSPGTLFESYGGQRWMNTVDLGSQTPDFFGMSISDQMEFLRKFLETSLEAAERLAN